MRDFKAGCDIHVGGDLHINDQSNKSKLFIDCTDEELFAEREYRKKALSRERKRALVPFRVTQPLFYIYAVF
jgi:hypothetical protein